jgi:DNA (cytosine-5)-methyltransferase 1
MLRALDLFCGQGGSSAGLAAAGFHVTGVDLYHQPNYPFPFHHGDALDLSVSWVRANFDLVTASPPCQAYTKCARIRGRRHPRLIAETRAFLERVGLPWVIENVEEARPELRTPVMLCGAQFGLRTYRHRLFEASFPIQAQIHLPHERRTVKMGRALRDGDFYHAVGNFSGVDYVRADLGVPWMTREGIRECIPPVYAQYVAHEFRHWSKLKRRARAWA